MTFVTGSCSVLKKQNTTQRPIHVRNVRRELTFPLAVPPLTPIRKGRCRGGSASLTASDTSMALRSRFPLKNEITALLRRMKSVIGLEKRRDSSYLDHIGRLHCLDCGSVQTHILVRFVGLMRLLESSVSRQPIQDRECRSLNEV